MDLAPLPGLLLQFEQTPGAELRHQRWSNAGSTGLERSVERDSNLALRAARCRGNGGAARFSAPARASCAARARATGQCMVAALRLYAQPGDDRRFHLLVDPGHRGICRMDDRRRQTNREESTQPYSGIIAPEGGNYEGWWK